MKKKVTYTVEEDVVNMFDKLAERKSINKSKWIEKQMFKFIQKEVE